MALEGTLETTVSKDATGQPSVEFAFGVRNVGSEAVDLQFADAARAEFVVQDEGREVWRFTDGRAFAQVLGSDRLAPDEETTYEERWDDPQPGEYTVVAELLARETACEARTELSVPADG
ncbi:BsuPI-related putative proteinase inhibitor [Natrarchaeobius oligotrophus]|uniref:Intracellular proteinase inhibitor BsuPI domain-containing protein n=1 Tax=Natrarchaeobius chitinivorans TaxID=1679083 RepID=A0A3N6MB34_NATCH|nr:BsuPI-related putative proteinase inhibitor [Natrarchaeobius chitinivorans]RQG99757.1 hypothetical protein EA472_13980 [Natrarchaeobius chitinivorans]